MKRKKLFSPEVIPVLTGSIVGKLIKRSSQKIGLSPGTVMHIGKRKVEETAFHVIDFSKDEVVERDLKKVDEAFPFKGRPTTTWLDIVGLHDTDVIVKVGEEFGLHPLVLEDIANTGQRPSIEDYGEYVFITLKMLSTNERFEIEAEHVSLIIAKDFVISFQEKAGDVFDGVRKRIRDKGRIVNRKSDYVGYALVDSVVDHYFLVLERIGERLEMLEDELNTAPEQLTLQKINKLKRELIFMRKSVWPLRDVLGQFKKVESNLLRKETVNYINDAYDHTIQVIDTVESLRDVATSLTDLYLSIVSNRMNEIMKVLTIFAAIFIPLTFVAGVYGMNFQNMPELSTTYGYYVVWGVFLVVGIGMFFYFRSKRWL